MTNDFAVCHYIYNMKRRRDIFTGIELASDKIRVVVASFQDQEQDLSKPDSPLVIRGFAEVPSLKMLKDEPVTPNIVAEQVSQALTAAWNMAACEGLPGVLALVLSGNYIRPHFVKASVQLDEHEAISEEDYESAMRATYSEVENLQGDDDNQEVIPLPLVNHGFRLADGRMVFNPVGQYSSTLTAESCCFVADVTRHEQVEAMIRDAMGGYQLDYVVYAPIAVASGVLQPTLSDEPQGLVIDLGAGMTSFAIPTKIGFVACEQLAVGMDHLANDLAIALTLEIGTARQIVEQLAQLRCTVVATHDGNARMVNVTEPGLNRRQRSFSADAIESILEVRLRELFQLVKNRLDEQGVYPWIGNEILLTGVGAVLPRVTELAAQIFNRRVRMALPYRVTGRPDFVPGPQHSTVLGLLRCACVEERLRVAQEAANDGGLLKKLKSFVDVMGW